ncbi:CsbD family protein [Acetobacterium tundrae]|uniref:CsbD family protein n=1 Tax=Acetobacterium tundrae TaxID=132932 RepID=A0ABR6WKE5_9FIRM|nr:CsbD family protein [Acetobacterium tundrae]MBC3796906.1 CsbD family protein [Acetobacterium tundrae]
MTDTKGKIESTKDKLVGGVKEAVGKVTNNEELELKGKIQSLKGELEGKAVDVGDKLGEIKEDVAEKINDFIDKKKEEK